MENLSPSGGENEQNKASDVLEFLDKYNEQKKQRDLPQLYGNLQSQDQGQRNRRPGSEVGSYVSDYGASARAYFQQNSQPSPSQIPGSLMGLEGSTSILPQPSTQEIEVDLSNSPSTETKPLHATLLSSGVECAIDKSKRFLPLGKLDAKCTEDAVRRELQQNFYSPDEVEKYVKYVCGDRKDPKHPGNSSRKIFSTLVIIREVKLIKYFAKHNINDEHLPFRRLDSNEEKDGVYDLVGRDPTNRQGSHPTSCFDEWESWQKHEFYTRQWTFLAPYITKAPDNSVALYDLDTEAILPWTKSLRANKGGYGTVSRVEIHPDHHNFNGYEWFAFKSLNDPDEAAFHKEFQALKRFEAGKHLLQVCAAFKKGDQYSFLFPWASGGNLRDLWKHHPLSLTSPMVPARLEVEKLTQRLILWVASQFTGLTGKTGLGGLHHANPSNSNGLLTGEVPRDYGIHGDIKPENILYFQDHKDEHGLGVLKIADFGLTGFHSLFSRSMQPRSGPCSPSYRAPETEIVEEFRTRKYDTWSLGCVLSEFMTWLIYGPDHLEKFATERARERKVNVPRSSEWGEDSFFNITIHSDGSKDVTVKNSVQSWIDGLMKAVEGKNYLHDCLKFIKEKLLNANRGERASCEETHEFMEKRYKKCYTEGNESYTKIKLSMLPDLVQDTSQNLPPMIEVSRA